MRYSPLALMILCLSICACNNSAPQNDAISPTPATTSTQPIPNVAPMIARMVTMDGCKDFSADMRMTAENESGKRETVEFKIQRKYSADQVSTFLAVVSPREDIDKAILAIEKPDQPTKATSYLAGLRKLAEFSSDRRLNLRGGKISVQEMLGMELDRYTHSAGERTTLEEGTLIKIDFKQKPDLSLAYPQIVGYFRESDGHPVRFELYNDRNELQKRMSIVEIKTIENRMTITKVTGEDLVQKFKLTLDTEKVKYDQGLSDSLFTEARLKNHITSAGQKLTQ
jgi:hypothetical protein